jgi:hypothetical protein
MSTGQGRKEMSSAAPVVPQTHHEPLRLLSRPAWADAPLARMRATLATDHPALARIVGPAAFDALAGRYLASAPLDEAENGGPRVTLPAFLESDPLTHRLAYLPDLARLERLMDAAFAAPGASPLRWDDMAALDTPRLLQLRFGLRPGAATLWSRWPLHEIWLTRVETNAGDFVVRRPTTLIVYKDGSSVRCAPLSHEEAWLVEAARQAVTLAELQQGSHDGRGEASALSVLARFRRLLDEGLFVRA